MNRLQVHRGPDGNGIWLDGECMLGLAHARLAVVDLGHGGAQPMWTGDGRFGISFNGEIYNWLELREQLVAQGCRFRSHSDTEVLLEGYRVWGRGVLDRVRGMYAFALYDRVEKKLFCARDPIGKKPLVYASGDWGFLMASEIPALLSMREYGFLVDDAVDHSAVASILIHNMRNIPEPATAYRGIRRLRPGHAMEIEEGRVARMWRHWHPRADRPKGASRRAIRKALEDSVRLRCRADVPVGALLSGGVDSTAIVALAQKLSREPVKTYALGSGPDDEDLRRARLAAAAIGTEHKEFYFDPEQGWERYRSLVSGYGDPIALLPLNHSLVLSEAVRDDGLKVVLSGHGADELFYGYTGHLRTARVSAWLSRLGWLRPAAAAWPRSQRPWPVALLAAEPGERKSALYRAFAGQAWGRVLRRSFVDDLHCVAADSMAEWGRLVPSSEFVDESNFVALLVENAHSVAISADLPGMKASVEMRCPFLDVEMIALASAITWQEKLYDRGSRPRLKSVLKDAVTDLVDESLLDAPKRGFGYEVQEADLFFGPWRNRVQNIFDSLDDLDGMLDAAKIRRVWDEFLGGARQHAALISKLVSIQLWRSGT